MTPLQFADHMMAKAGHREHVRRGRGGGVLIVLALAAVLVFGLLAIAHAQTPPSPIEAPPAHIPAWTWV